MIATIDLIYIASSITTIIVLVSFLLSSTVSTLVDIIPFDWDWVKKIRINRAISSLEILKGLGILNLDAYKNIAFRNKLTVHYSTQSEYIEHAKTFLESHVIPTKVVVGVQQPFQADNYINLLGASTCPNTVMMMASFLEEQIRWSNAQFGDIDCIIGVKGGAPLLAAEMAKRLEKPLLLHRSNHKLISFFGEEMPILQYFDCPTSNLKLPLFKALVVDEGFTGASMLLKAAQDFEKSGRKTVAIVVLAEVIAKGGRDVLSNAGFQVLPCFKFDPKNGTILNP